MPLPHSLLHYGTSRQPGGLVEIQSIQELLPNHLHRLSKPLLKKHTHNCTVKDATCYDGRSAAFFKCKFHELENIFFRIIQYLTIEYEGTSYIYMHNIVIKELWMEGIKI